MSLMSSESIGIEEKDFHLKKIFFEKEYMNYNYTLSVMTESANYSLTTIFVPEAVRKYNNNQLAVAAKELQSDYIEDDELTMFKSLDSEGFYE